MKKTNSSKRAIIISLIIHTIAFIIIAMIKLDSGVNAKGKVPVSFVKTQNVRVLKRSISVREISLDNSLKQKPEYENLLTNANNFNNDSGIIFGTSSQSKAELRSITPVSMHGIGTQKLKSSFDAQPINIATRDTQVRTAQPGAEMSGGFKFGNAPVELAKPQMKASDTERKNVLQDFLNGIKKKIESKKKYPLAARNAGIEGRSGIQMTITRDGQVESVRIYESSGNEILDNAALDSVKDALPFPPIPDGVEREKIEIKLYLVFKIT